MAEAAADSSTTSTESVAAPQYTEVEQQAMEHGWRPKEEFQEQPGKKWRSAEEFMDRKPLYDKLEEQSRKIKQLDQGLKTLADHNAGIEKAAYQRALNELKSAKTQALEAGDLVQVEKIRDQIDELKQAPPAAVAGANPPQAQAEFESWQKRNGWYNTDEDLTAFADGLGNKLQKQGKTPAEIMATVEEKIKQVFPEKFTNPNKASAPKMEEGTRKSTRSGGFELTEAEEHVFKVLNRADPKLITREKYIADIKIQRSKP